MFSGQSRALDKTLLAYTEHVVRPLEEHCMVVHSFLCSPRKALARDSGGFVKKVWAGLRVKMHSIPRENISLPGYVMFSRMEQCWRDLLGVAEPRLKETYEFIIRTRPGMLWKGTFPVHHLSDKALQGKVLVRARRFEGMGKFDVPTSALTSLGGCDLQGDCAIHFKEPKNRNPASPSWLTGSTVRSPACFMVDDQFAVIPREYGPHYFIQSDEGLDINDRNKTYSFQALYSHCLTCRSFTPTPPWPEVNLTARLLRRSALISITPFNVVLIGSSVYTFPDPMSGNMFKC